MPEGVVRWSCPKCGEQNSSAQEVCHRCGADPSPFAVPPHKCPACGGETDEPAPEGRIHCPKCGTDFEDYEEWVRRCRAAAFAATRPVPPPPEEPAPRPAFLTPVAAGLLATAAVYLATGLAVGRLEVTVPAVALALVQVLAAVALWTEWRHADGVARFAAGLSALVPLFAFPVLLFVGLFASFCLPEVMRYFGSRPDPLTDRLRHPVIAWLLVSLAVVTGLFAAVLLPALDLAVQWNDPGPPLMDLGAGVAAFFARNWWWAPAGVLGGVVILALWGRVNRHAFLGVSVLAILGVLAIGVPPVLEAWLFTKSAAAAETYLHERDVQRLLWGAREGEADPKIRTAAIRAMSDTGRNASVLVPALLRSIRDPDRRVRAASAVALAQFDPSVEEVLPTLIGVLDDDRSDRAEKDRAAVALGYLGPRARPALPLLLERLRRGDAATLSLVEIGPASIPGLTAALSDPDPKVRKRAAYALRLHGPTARSAVPQLLERLKDDDVAVRTAAVAALGEIHRDKAIPVLLEVLRRDPPAAKAAAEALCALGQRQGLPELPQGCSAMNVMREPTLWEHLNRTAIDRDFEGSGAEILADAAGRAGLCAEVAPEAAALPALTSFRRIAAAARKRSVLEVLQSFDVEFVLESDRVRVLSPDQARAFWSEWLSTLPKKPE